MEKTIQYYRDKLHRLAIYEEDKKTFRFPWKGGFSAHMESINLKKNCEELGIVKLHHTNFPNPDTNGWVYNEPFEYYVEI